MLEDDSLNIEELFEDDEMPTQRDGLRMSVLNLLSDLEAVTGETIRTLQTEGLTASSKTKAAYSLIKINRIVREIEASFGIYHFTATPKDPTE